LPKPITKGANLSTICTKTVCQPGFTWTLWGNLQYFPRLDLREGWAQGLERKGKGRRKEMRGEGEEMRGAPRFIILAPPLDIQAIYLFSWLNILGEPNYG